MKTDKNPIDDGVVNPRKENYRKLGKTKREQREQISFRVGSKIVRKLDDFAKKSGGKKVDIIKHAVCFWISINGNPKYFENIIADLRKELEIAKALIGEKDERIKELLEIFSNYKKE